MALYVKRKNTSMLWQVYLKAVLMTAFLWALVLFLCLAHAHEGDSPLAAWYRSLKTSGGTSCCSETDCVPVEARLMSNHWEVFMSNGPLPVWEIVPPEVVLTRDNPEGRAVLCRFGGRILCFVPASGV